MTHIVVGLFKNEHQAGKAVAALMKQVSAKDISLITKDSNTGKILVHQVKQAGELTEAQGTDKGMEIGGVAGAIGGLSTIIHPAMASLVIIGPMMIVLGLIGATLGGLFGGFIGAENEDALPPERARLYKDRIHKGEIFVSVSTDKNHQATLIPIFKRFEATHVQGMTTDL